MERSVIVGTVDVANTVNDICFKKCSKRLTALKNKLVELSPKDIDEITGIAQQIWQDADNINDIKYQWSRLLKNLYNAVEECQNFILAYATEMPVEEEH